MKVSIVIGDLFESEAQVLTNAINCIGVMGAGIALGFANRFPAMLKEYEEKCRRDEVSLDEPYLWVNDEGEGYGHHPDILNFPTMYYPGEQADLTQILRGFDHVIAKAAEWELESLAVPALGCGIGGLLFDDVREPFSEKLEQLGIPVKLYAPNEKANLSPYHP